MADRERLTRTLMDLIRIDSPTGEEDAVDREVSVRLQALGFQVYHDSFQNIIAKLDGQGEPVILSAHPGHPACQAGTDLLKCSESGSESQTAPFHDSSIALTNRATRRSDSV